MFKRNKSQEGDAGNVSTKPKLSVLTHVIVIVALAVLGALITVIKLSQIFHWWLTPPW